MTPFYADDWLTIYEGDCKTVMEGLPADSVDCVVTSPPYWGLRDYGTATWDGGDAECEHSVSQADADNKAVFDERVYRGDRSRCLKCGATRQDSQLGLERTPEEYVANMVAVFREVRRVLKPSGTCWLNLGDSYAAGGGSGAQRLDQLGERLGTGGGKKHSSRPSGRAPSAGLAHKQLVGIPWRVAFALQADGWYLRSDIIWSKPNPMPESVTDRPTKSHEYLFLLTKSARYYFDADAVREANTGAFNDFPSHAAVGNGTGRQRYDANGEAAGPSGHVGTNPAGRNIRSVWTIATVPYGSSTIGDAEGGHRDTLSPDCPVHSLRAIRRSRQTVGDDGLLDHLRSRNPRSGSRPEPMPSDGLFASLDLDSPGPDPSTPDYQDRRSSDATIRGSADESRTPDQPTSVDGQGFDVGTEPRTSRTLAPTNGTDQDEPSGLDAPAATGRSERENRTSEQSAQPDSSEPSSAAGTPDTSGQSGSVCSCPNYSASHFAVFPPELPERCIKAGSSERGVCPECGAPWERVVERESFDKEGWGAARKDHHGPVQGAQSMYRDGNGRAGRVSVQTLGWRPSCLHNGGGRSPTVSAEPSTEGLRGSDPGVGTASDVTPWPAVVLDPFAGSGTVGLVANRLSRRAILIDLNPEYLKQQMKRNAQTPLGLGAA